MIITRQPDSLSLLGNMKHLVVGSIGQSEEVAMDVWLGAADVSTPLVSRTYVPNADGTVDIDLEEICRSCLSFILRDSVDPYRQTDIVRSFSVRLTGSASVRDISFTVLRGGVELLADSVANFLTQNFLTWQPNMKPVTYYTPEFLTYYATVDCVVKARFYLHDGYHGDMTLATLGAGTCWTIPVGYQVISGKTRLLHSYHDVWVQDTSGNRLTYTQRYYASDARSEEESWILFENSLGGIDTFRAYGDAEVKAEHEHQVATVDGVSTEYRVDVKRRYKKSTGFLDKRERRWLLDFFPSLGKFVCENGMLRRIVVTESDVDYSVKELPSEYSFTYKYADEKPYLNLARIDTEFQEMDIKIPDVGSFTIAPRLAEFPRLQLSGGALFPVQNPYSEEWGATTLSTLAQYLADELLYLADFFGESHFLSRLHDDVANGRITFMQGLTTLGTLVIGSYVKGLRGGVITPDAVAELEELWVRATAIIGDGTRHRDQDGRDVPALAVRGDATFTDNLSSPNFTSGFLGGLGWAIRKTEYVNAAGVPEYKYTFEADNAVFRNTLRVYEMIVSQLLGENDNRVFSSCMEIDHYDPDTSTLYLNTWNGKLYNTFRTGDLVEVQQFNGMPDATNDHYVTKAYEFRVVNVGVGSLADGVDRKDWITIENFTSQIAGLTPETAFKAGDTIVRMDSDTDPNRKGIITIMTVGADMPYIDLLYGLKTDPEHAQKGRIGNLEGVRTEDYGWLQGFGIYTNNIYATGSFHDHQTGESLTSRINATKASFSSVYKETTFDISEKDNLVSNGFFTNGLADWTVVRPDGSQAGAQGMSGILSSEDTPIMINGRLITLKNVEQAAVIEYDSLPMLKLNAMGVAQSFADMGEHTTHKEMVDGSSSETRDVGDTLYMGVRILPLTEGDLSVQFVRSSGVSNGWSRHILSSLEWMLVQEQDSTISPWDFTGQGRMILSYTGECLIRFVTLTTDPIADRQVDYMTRITQTARIIKAEADAVYSTKTMHSELSIQVGLIAAEVTRNKEASDRALSTLSGRIGNLETWENDTATWIYQTDSTINLWAAQFDANGNIKRFTGIEQSISDIRTTVTNNYNASETAFETLRARALALETFENNTATWIYQTDSTINLWAAQFDSYGNLKNYSTRTQTAEMIRTTVESYGYATGAMVASAIDQAASSITARVSAIENSRKALGDPNGWRRWKLSNPSGGSLTAGAPVYHIDSEYYLSYAHTVNVSSNTKFYINSPYFLLVAFVNASGNFISSSIQPGSNTGALDITIPSGASGAYLMVYRYPEVTTKVALSEVTSFGLIYTENNIMTEASFSLWVSNSMSWLQGNADNIIFNFGKKFELQCKSVPIARIKDDGRLAVNADFFGRYFGLIDSEAEISPDDDDESTPIHAGSLTLPYKAQYITIKSGTATLTEDIEWNNGGTVIIQGSHTSNPVYVRLPSQSNIRSVLGIEAGEEFVVEMNIINLSNYDYLYLQYSTTTGANTAYPRMMNWDNGAWQGNDARMQMGSGDFLHIVLVYHNNYYNAYTVIHKDSGGI